MHLLGFTDTHAYHRAFRRDSEFGGITADAVDLREIALSTAWGDILLFLTFRQDTATKKGKIQNTGQKQSNADRCDCEQIEGVHSLRARWQAAVGIGDQVVKQDQGRVGHQRHVGAGQDGEAHRQKQPFEWHAGARADSADHRYKQSCQCLALDDRGQCTDGRGDGNGQARFNAPGHPQYQAGRFCQHAGSIQTCTHDHDGDQ